MFNDAITHLLNPGGVGVIPTDTVYGIVARAADPEAVKRLYMAKSREDKPGTVIAASTEQLEELGLKHRYLKAVDQFWPGAVSVVIPLSDQRLNYLTLNKLSLAVRIPDYPELLETLKKTGPLLTSSANLPGQKPAENIREARDYFGNRVDFYTDGGNKSGFKPSTVIRVLDDAIEVLRQGAVAIDPRVLQ